MQVYISAPIVLWKWTRYNDMCKLCTMMITHENEHNDIFSTLDYIYLEIFSISDEHSRRTYNIWRFKHTSLNVHIYENQINPSYRKTKIMNFGEINFAAASYCLLIHYYLLTISSRVFLNPTFHGITVILISRKLIDRECLHNFRADLIRL